MGVIKASKLTPIFQYSFILPSPVIMHLRQSTLNKSSSVGCYAANVTPSIQYSLFYHIS